MFVNITNNYRRYMFMEIAHKQLQNGQLERARIEKSLKFSRVTFTKERFTYTCVLISQSSLLKRQDL
jgi:hypothetical protein